MKKIASNLLIVSTQLVVGGLFLFMLFSNGVEDNKVVVVKNNNLNKMADSVSELFVADQLENVVASDTKEVNLMDEEEAAKKRAEEEAKKKAEEEAARKKAEEEAARKKAEEEAARKKAESAVSSGYNSSTGHTTYTLSDADFNIVAGVVACEATSYEDALGVASVILNRVDSGSYPSTPLAVVSAPSQFSCYGYYLNNPGRFAANRSNYADEALRVALSGTRNNNFYSFNCVCSSPNGVCTQIGGGNWYY